MTHPQKKFKLDNVISWELYLLAEFDGLLYPLERVFTLILKKERKILINNFKLKNRLGWSGSSIAGEKI